MLQKLKETISAVAPIMLIVLALGLTVAPLGAALIARFLIGSVLLIAGLTLFLQGVDIGILPIGERSGAALTGKRNVGLLLSAAFVIGFMITVAEPDVQVLADQFMGVNSAVNKAAFVAAIALGVGIFVTLGLARTLFSIPLNFFLFLCYAALFAVAALVQAEFVGVSFDAGGATTGPMTVPFIMALGLGVANSMGKKDSFGLTGIASVGPVLAVLVYSLMLSMIAVTTDTVQETAAEETFFSGNVFLSLLPEIIHEVVSSLLPLVALFIVFQFFLLKMPPVQLVRMFVGVGYSFVGLIVFMLGVKGGFMTAGLQLGQILGAAAAQSGAMLAVLVCAGLLLGAVTVCAEPAVYVLTGQVEEASGGNIRRKVMLVSLALGVAAAVALSLVRGVTGFSLWYILIPGYAIALVLAFFCPPLFTGIAFDSGGVASGPMTSTFILTFVLGATQGAAEGNAANAFGVIALVALAPLIAIQILGLIYTLKGGKK